MARVLWRLGLAALLALATCGTVQSAPVPQKASLTAVRLGFDPAGMATDPSSHHIFVVSLREQPCDAASSNRGCAAKGPFTVTTYETPSLAALRTVTLPALNGLPSSLAVSLQEHHLYIGTLGNTPVGVLGVVDTRSGSFLPTIIAHPAVPLRPSLSMSAGPDLVAVSDADRVVVAVTQVRIEEGSGEVRQNRLAVVSNSSDRTLPAAALPADTVPTSIAVDGKQHTAYLAGTGNNRLYTFSLDSGALLHTTAVDANPVGLAVDTAAATVLVTTSAPPSADLVDARSGRLLSRTSLPRMRYAVPPVLDGGIHRAYVAEPAAFLPGQHNAGSGTVQMIDTRTGRLIGKVGVGVDPVALTVDVYRHLVIAANAGNAHLAGGTISEFDSRSGKSIKTIPLPGHPRGLVLDRHAGTIAVTLGALLTSNNALTQSQIDRAGQLVLVAE